MSEPNIVELKGREFLPVLLLSLEVDLDETEAVWPSIRSVEGRRARAAGRLFEVRWRESHLCEREVLRD